MVDISGSMAPCIDALRTNIEAFIDSLSKGEANNAPPIRDWRGKVVGYRDIEAAQTEGLPWIVDAPFVRDAGELKAQLSQLRAEGGGDEPDRSLMHFSKPPRWKPVQRAHRAKIRISGGTGAMRRVW